MSDFEQLEQTFTAYGWTKRRGKGDHFYFRHPSSPTEIRVSMSISPREIRNMVSRARKIDPNFVYIRRGWTPPKEKPKNMEESLSRALNGVCGYESEPVAETSPATLNALPTKFPKSRPDMRRFRWIMPGIPVRYSALVDWDYKKLNEPNSAINHKWFIDSITENGKVIIRDSDGGTKVEAFANDLDTWETETCDLCGEFLPISNMVRRNKKGYRCLTCNYKLIKSYDMKKQETKKTIEETVVDNMIAHAALSDNPFIQEIVNDMHFRFTTDGNVKKLILLLPQGLAVKDLQETLIGFIKPAKPFIVDYEADTRYEAVYVNDSIHYQKVKPVEEPETPDEKILEEIKNETQDLSSIFNKEIPAEKKTPSIEELIEVLKNTAIQLRELGVTVKIKKIKYTEKKEITIFKNVKHSIKI